MNLQASRQHISLKLSGDFALDCFPPLQLSETERAQLQQLVHRHHTPQQIAVRASIILFVEDGRNHRAIQSIR
jgi:hypothetical protein